MHRLGVHPEEWLDRSTVLTFEFEGAAYQGFGGDTISSALAAAGVPYLARSFKYHRPRHLLSFANHDSNALFQVDGVPNVRGDVTPLRNGMRVTAVNTFGGLARDRARHLDRLARWLPVGFYYKAFHTKRLFPRWERMFRRLTGLGAVSLDAPRQTSAKRFGFCDVLVIGGGPSGLAAALEAAAAGARVTLVEESSRLGGSGLGRENDEQGLTRALVDEVFGAPALAIAVRAPAFAIADEGVRAPTFAIADEGVRAPTFAIADEGVRAPTFAIADEGVRAPTFAIADEGVRAPTFAIADEAVRAPTRAIVDETVHSPIPALAEESLLPQARVLIDAPGRGSISVCCATVAAGYYADHWVALVDDARLTKMRAKAVVFATGVIEQPAVFRNNDLPGVMLASAARRLLLRHRVAPGRRIVMVAANIEAYRTCLELHAQGVGVTAIVDLRAAGDEVESAACVALGMSVVRGHAPYAAVAGRGGAVAALEIARFDGVGHVDPAKRRRIECDAVLMSVGWAAAANLLLQAGGTLRFSASLQQFVPDAVPPGAFAAGRLNGVYEFAARVADGARAGSAAAAHAGFGAASRAQAIAADASNTQACPASANLLAATHMALVGANPAAANLAEANLLEASPAHASPAGPGAALRSAAVRAAAASAADSASAPRCPSHPFPIVDHPQAKNFVDFDEDLQVKDLENAAQEGFDSSELLKRYSTVGMGPSQGKHSNMNALRVLARYRGVGVEQLGLTTSRPMYHPVPLKLLAGRSFNVERRTAVDAEHESLGAVWMPAGNWRRPEYYAVAGESRAQSIDAEVAAVRGRVGLIDVGTLGKIEVFGPQAGVFLDRVYAGRYADLRVGMTRYGLMLDESGVIIDDGVIARLAPELYYFTTTTGGSATVFRELLRLNALWGLDCALANVTGHRAAFNLAGPASRDVLQPITDVDLGDAAFPYLGVRSGRVAGVECRLLRVGFVGELGYEIHVAAGPAAYLWRALCAAGAPRGLRPFGVEAQRVLRLEKGHFIVGQDTDGLTDPYEANAAWAVQMQKPFFVGQRSLQILRKRGPRQLLVGIELANSAPLPRECQLVIDKGAIAGRVTSVAHSRTLEKSIGLAMLAPDLARRGGEIEIRGDAGVMVKARIVSTPFYDPKSARQRPAATGAGAAVAAQTGSAAA